jgi:hypothetical protein
MLKLGVVEGAPSPPPPQETRINGAAKQTAVPMAIRLNFVAVPVMAPIVTGSII